MMKQFSRDTDKLRHSLKNTCTYVQIHGLMENAICRIWQTGAQFQEHILCQCEELAKLDYLECIGEAYSVMSSCMNTTSSKLEDLIKKTKLDLIIQIIAIYIRSIDHSGKWLQDHPINYLSIVDDFFFTPPYNQIRVYPHSLIKIN